MMNPYSPDGQPIGGFFMDQSGHLPMRHPGGWPAGKSFFVIDGTKLLFFIQVQPNGTYCVV